MESKQQIIMEVKTDPTLNGKLLRKIKVLKFLCLGSYAVLALCLILTICGTYQPKSSVQKCLPNHQTAVWKMFNNNGTKQQQQQQQQQSSFLSSRMIAPQRNRLSFAVSYRRNRRRRATPYPAKLMCRTDTPKCLDQRKHVVLFSEEFDVDLHYTLNRPVISLLCRLTNKPISCEQRTLPPEGVFTDDINLDVNINNEQNVIILHNYAFRMNQFVQSLAAMMKYFKGINEPIANNLEMIHNKFLELLKKMLKFKQDLLKCGRCQSMKFKDPPSIHLFNSHELLALLPPPGEVDVEILQSQYIISLVYKFLQQMSVVFRRQERCFAL